MTSVSLDKILEVTLRMRYVGKILVNVFHYGTDSLPLITGEGAMAALLGNVTTNFYQLVIQGNTLPPGGASGDAAYQDIVPDSLEFLDIRTRPVVTGGLYDAEHFSAYGSFGSLATGTADILPTFATFYFRYNRSDTKYKRHGRKAIGVVREGNNDSGTFVADGTLGFSEMNEFERRLSAGVDDGEGTLAYPMILRKTLQDLGNPGDPSYYAVEATWCKVVDFIGISTQNSRK